MSRLERKMDWGIPLCLNVYVIYLRLMLNEYSLILGQHLATIQLRDGTQSSFGSRNKKDNTFVCVEGKRFEKCWVVPEWWAPRLSLLICGRDRAAPCRVLGDETLNLEGSHNVLSTLKPKPNQHSWMNFIHCNTVDLCLPSGSELS